MGYIVHLSETCDEGMPRLLMHAETTPASVHEAMRTAAIHEALAEKGLPPREHLVDAAYVSAGHLVESHERHEIDWVGPTRKNASWQQQTERGYTADRFEVDWEQEKAWCPEGKASTAWGEYESKHRGRHIVVRFSRADCQGCPSRCLCTRAKKQGRTLILHPRQEHEALEAARERHASEKGQQLYRLRQGVEGTLSQGVRCFGLRRARYRGLKKTHLQHLATAAALNLDRAAAWLEGRPLAKTRTSRFMALAA